MWLVIVGREFSEELGYIGRVERTECVFVKLIYTDWTSCVCNLALECAGVAR